jgi:GT2 family glycosyltransferase
MAAFQNLSTQRDFEEIDFKKFEYHFFNENLKHSLACNVLADASTDTDVLFFLNPDCVVSPLAISRLIKVLLGEKCSAVDAKQIPCIHPKYYDPHSGETNWVSGAALMVLAPTFKAVGGFDHLNFPMYVNDVDLSWRIKLTGGTLRHVPNAAVFHDKQLDDLANVIPTKTERIYSIHAGLCLQIKYGRRDLAEKLIESLPQGDPKIEELRESFDRYLLTVVPLEYDESLSHNIQFQEGDYGKRMF